MLGGFYLRKAAAFKQRGACLGAKVFKSTLTYSNILVNCRHLFSNQMIFAAAAGGGGGWRGERGVCRR